MYITSRPAITRVVSVTIRVRAYKRRTFARSSANVVASVKIGSLDVDARRSVTRSNVRVI